MYAGKGKVILYTGQIRGFLSLLFTRGVCVLVQRRYFHQRRIEYNHNSASSTIFKAYR